jgi:hypothetical protein
MNEIPRVDSELRKEIAREARSLIEDRAFMQAVADLRKQWHGELMLDATTDEQAKLLRAKMMALEAIPQRLASMMHDDQFGQRGTPQARQNPFPRQGS